MELCSNFQSSIHSIFFVLCEVPSSTTVNDPPSSMDNLDLAGPATEASLDFKNPKVPWHFLLSKATPRTNLGLMIQVVVFWPDLSNYGGSRSPLPPMTPTTSHLARSLHNLVAVVVSSWSSPSLPHPYVPIDAAAYVLPGK